MTLHLDLCQIFSYLLLWDKSEEVVTKSPWIYFLIYVFTKLPWYLECFICLVEFGNWGSYVINKSRCKKPSNHIPCFSNYADVRYFLNPNMYVFLRVVFLGEIGTSNWNPLLYISRITYLMSIQHYTIGMQSI